MSTRHINASSNFVVRIREDANATGGGSLQASTLEGYGASQPCHSEIFGTADYSTELVNSLHERFSISTVCSLCLLHA